MCSLKQIARLALAGGLLCGLLPCPNRARAADDLVAGSAIALPQRAKMANRGLPVGVQDAQATPVDRWLFPPDQAVAIRRNMEASLTRQLAEVKRCCDLSDAQADKLSLAMQCDVTQFFEDVEQLREKFPQRNRDSISEEMQQEVMRLHAKFRIGGGGLCGPGSFFEKTRPHILDSQQSVKYQAIVDERLHRRYLIAVDVALQDLEDGVPLDSRQHETIRRLLVAGSLPHVTRTWTELMPLAMYRLAEIPADQLQPLLNDHQFIAFIRHRTPYLNYREHCQLFGLLTENE